MRIGIYIEDKVNLQSTLPVPGFQTVASIQVGKHIGDYFYMGHNGKAL